MQVLVVEDEPKVAAVLKQGLEEHGYDTTIVYDGQMGLRTASHDTFDLIILDLIIPYINGLELCKEIKRVTPSVPVLMVTALGTTDDKVAGFDAGADDYLVKPFEFKELLARVKALTKRQGIAQTSKSLQVADLALDLDRKVAVRGDKTIELTAKEFGLLELLMRNRGRVLSRAEIAEKVWEHTFDTGTNVVDVYVNLLRKKIDRDFEHKLIHTRVGMGYVLKES
jgi:DNA-binding response OmpR family regulator